MENFKMKIFSIGEKIWIISLILYIVWVLIGIKLEQSPETISIIGSIGMIVFVTLTNLIRKEFEKYRF